MHRVATSSVLKTVLNSPTKRLAGQNQAAKRMTMLLRQQPQTAFFSSKSTERALTQAFSSIAVNPEGTNIPGTIERPLKALDMALVRKIKSELMEVDANSDGRIDSEELKALLRRHSTSFTDAEIVEIGELYYASKGGESSSIESFIEAIDLSVLKRLDSEKLQDKLDGHSSFDDRPPTEHFKEGARHPLGLGSCGVEFLHTTKSHHGHYSPEELDIKIIHTEPKDARDRLAFNCVKLMRKWFDLFTGWNNDSITGTCR